MKILLSTDGSVYSDGAAYFLARFDFTENDEITVLHVVHGRTFSHSSDTNYAALMQIGEEIAPGIVDETAGLLKNLPAKVSTAVATGHPAEGILHVAAQTASDLIVMGNRGMKAIGSLLLGSVTRAVAIKAPQSVLVVKPPQGRPDGPIRVLFATDGSDCARETERILSLLPFHPDTSITAVYVSLLTYMDIPDRFCPGFDERLKKVMTGMKEAETHHAEKVLEQARSRLKGRFQNVSVLIRNGDPSEQLLQAARETQADVIALGSRGMGGVSGMLGSVARNVLSHADCSVLICKLKEETA
ncbi:MAG: universal stress protein [Thermodesulfovibrionales bacterium]|jgi:nucleotide-binding universal stress UspA family protein